MSKRRRFALIILALIAGLCNCFIAAALGNGKVIRGSNVALIAKSDVMASLVCAIVALVAVVLLLMLALTGRRAAAS